MKIRVKKELILIVLIVLITFLFLLPIFTNDFYNSHDGEAHLARFAAYYSAFQDGQIIPRWAGNLNFSYGTPVFIFYYPLPGYIASLIHHFGFNFEISFKFLIGLSFIAAPLTFYLWVKRLFKKEVAFLGSLFYGFAPYHFLNLYVRGDVAEILAFVFVPLVFLFIDKLIEKFALRDLLLGGLSYGLLILSHNGVSLMFSPIFLFYIFLRNKNKKTILSTITLILLGLALSVFFWLPAIYEAKFTNANLFIGDMYKEHFLTFSQLLYSPWGFGPDVAKPGGLSPQVGVLHILLAFGTIVLLFKNNKEKRIILGWLAVFLLSIFITLPISFFLWEQLPLIKKFEFPWRFIGLASFAATVLVCYVLAIIKNKKILIGIMIILLISSIPFVKMNPLVSRNDNFYHAFTGTTYFHGEANPMWTAGDPGEYPKAPVELIGGRGMIVDIKKKSQLHTYTVDAKDTVTIVDNTHYFPGWKVKIVDKEVPIQFQDPNYRGLITFTLPEGRHSVKVEFGESKIRLFSDFISLIVWVILIIVVVFLYAKKLGKLLALLYNKKAFKYKKIVKHERKNKKSSK